MGRRALTPEGWGQERCGPQHLEEEAAARSPDWAVGEGSAGWVQVLAQAGACGGTVP